MDSFIFKLTNIFDYCGDTSVFQVFKNETLYYLNDKNLRNVDYKSVGSLFGMNYIQDNLKKIDIMIEFGYDLYILRNFILDLVNFYCDRKILTSKSCAEIINIYALDEYALIKCINKQNEKRKFKILQKKVWHPLNYMIKNNKNNKNNENNKYNDTNTNLSVSNDDDDDNNSDYNNSELNTSDIKDKTILKKSIIEDTMQDEGWQCIYKKKTSTKKMDVSDSSDIFINNRFKNLEGHSEEISVSNVNQDIGEYLPYDADSDVKQMKREDKKKFENIKIYKKYDTEDENAYNDRVIKLENSEKNIEKIIDKIKCEIYEKKKKRWAEISDSNSELSID